MQAIRIDKIQCFHAEIFSVLTACMAHPIQPDIKRRYQMKRLPKMLCALILCALMVTAAVSCGQKPAQQEQNPPQQEDPQPAPELKIAVDSDPARSAVIHWFYSEEGQALFGDKDLNDVLFSVDPRDIAQELKLGNYDAAVCAPDQKALQLLGGYESMPLLKDAVIFVHGNIGQEDADYNLSSETLRGIYAGTAPLFWDEAQTQPLVPAYGYANDAQDPLWQLMSMQFGFTADAVRLHRRCAGYPPNGDMGQPCDGHCSDRTGGIAAVPPAL